MFTLDASVWVNGFDYKEPGARITQRLLMALAEQDRLIIVPSLVLVEVAGSISRTRRQPAKAIAFADTIARLPHVTVVPLTTDLADAAAQLAARYALRGADAIYAAVALSARCTLVSLDGEHLTRLQNVVPTLTPTDALDAM